MNFQDHRVSSESSVNLGFQVNVVYNSGFQVNFHIILGFLSNMKISSVRFEVNLGFQVKLKFIL